MCDPPASRQRLPPALETNLRVLLLPYISDFCARLSTPHDRIVQSLLLQNIVDKETGRLVTLYRGC